MTGRELMRKRNRNAQRILGAVYPGQVHFK